MVKMLLYASFLFLSLATVANCSKLVVNGLSDKHTYDVIDDSATLPPLLRHSSSGNSNSYILKPLDTDLDFVDYAQLAVEQHSPEGVIDLPPVPPTAKPAYKIPKISKSQDGFLPEANTPDYGSRHLNDVVGNDDIDELPPLPPVPTEQNHKVYNLVLNPDKHSWCELKPIRQIITHAHCNSKEMENSVCVGSCFSYSVPQTEPETPGDEMLDYCDSCQAEESFWTTVQLDCEEDGSTYTVTKNIQRIGNCSCAPCRQNRRHETLTNSEPSSSTTSAPSSGTSDVFFSMLPHPDRTAADPMAQLMGQNYFNVGKRYNQISLGELKKEFLLNETQEALLSGKLLRKDVASFREEDGEEEAIYN